MTIAELRMTHQQMFVVIYSENAFFLQTGSPPKILKTGTNSQTKTMVESGLGCLFWAMLYVLFVGVQVTTMFYNTTMHNYVL